jgi:hypothetical protein
MSYFLSSSIPDHIYKDISEKITTYSVALLRVELDPPGIQNADQVGSGTFVSNGNDNGILTAYHVITEFTPDNLLGINLSLEEDNYQIPWNEIIVENIGIPITDENGPDLVYLHLLPSHVERIRKYKSFYSLDEYKDELLSKPPDLDIGLWVVCGGLQEKTKIEESQVGFIACITMEQYCGFGEVKRGFALEEYDYLEFDMKYSPGLLTPATLKGMSGGGLWQIPIWKGEFEDFIPNRYLYSGVAFWQSPVNDCWRFLRCHGRKSIYEIGLGKINK